MTVWNESGCKYLKFLLKTITIKFNIVNIYVWEERMKKSFAILFVIILTVVSCKTVEKPESGDKFEIENKKFLTEKPKNGLEVFRVLLQSDGYSVAQKSYGAYIQRKKDDAGDKYYSQVISEHDKIDEAREGMVTVWLYPDSGRLMQIRFLKSTYLRELDDLIIEDIQRWQFNFPKRVVEPAKFNVRYRIVLRKKMSDEEIMDEVRQNLREKTGQ